MQIVYYVIRILYAICAVIFLSLSAMTISFLSYVLSKLRIGPVRCLKGKILTPVIYLKNPKTERKIVLIGMMHIGKRKYFEEIQSLIDSLSGYKILYEGIGKLGPGQRKLFSQQERETYRDLKNSMKSRSIISAMLKLQGQKKGLKYDEEKWIRTDMNVFDFVRKTNKEKVSALKKSTIKFSALIKGKSEKALARWLFQAVLLKLNVLVSFVEVINLFSKKKRNENRIILKERNQIALDGIFTHTKDSDVVSIWGAMHLVGMLQALKKEGYKQTKKEWYVAYEKNPAYLKMLIDSLKTDE